MAYVVLVVGFVVSRVGEDSVDVVAVVAVDVLIVSVVVFAAVDVVFVFVLAVIAVVFIVIVAVIVFCVSSIVASIVLDAVSLVLVEDEEVVKKAVEEVVAGEKAVREKNICFLTFYTFFEQQTDSLVTVFMLGR